MGRHRALAWLAFSALLAFLATPLFGRLELQADDARRSLRADHGWPKDLLLVRIDDNTLARLGRLPWPRSILTRYVVRLEALGAKTILLDSITTAPSATGPEEDRALADALGRALIGGGYRPEGGQAASLEGLVPFPGSERAAWRRTLRADQLVPPLPLFVQRGAGWGVPVFFPEADGKVRAFPPFLGVHGVGRFPTLATAGWLHQRGVTPADVHGDASSFRAGDRTFPLDDGDLLLDLSGKRLPPSLSLLDLDGDDAALAKKVAGKLTLVYVDTTASLDKMPSPLGPSTPGGLLLAYSIRTLELGFVPRRVPPVLPLSMLAVAGAGALLFTRRRTPGSILAVAATLAIAHVIAAALMVRLADSFVPVTMPLGFIALAAMCIVVDSGREADVERRRLRELLESAKKSVPGATGSRPLADVDSGAPSGPAARIAEAPASQSGPSGAPLAGSALATPVEIRQYRIERAIGRGGMGAIFLGRDTTLDRYVAIKVLQGTDPNSFVRFRREALAIARINHPNVVHVYEIGMDASVPYIVMEFVPGGTLHELLQEANTRLHWSRAARIGACVARGLSAAHEKGIVHRDVKPSNILLMKQTGTEAKIADFGIAKLGEGQAEALTAPEMVVGSVGYLSPEQATGQEVTPASDVFSLGITLYRMIAGRMAFTGTVAERLYATVHTPVDDVRRWAPETPPEVALLIQRWTSMDVSARPADAASAARELDALVTRAPVTPPIALAAIEVPVAPDSAPTVQSRKEE